MIYKRMSYNLQTSYQNSRLPAASHHSRSPSTCSRCPLICSFPLLLLLLLLLRLLLLLLPFSSSSSLFALLCLEFTNVFIYSPSLSALVLLNVLDLSTRSGTFSNRCPSLTRKWQAIPCLKSLLSWLSCPFLFRPSDWLGLSFTLVLSS